LLLLEAAVRLVTSSVLHRRYALVWLQTLGALGIHGVVCVCLMVSGGQLCCGDLCASIELKFEASKSDASNTSIAIVSLMLQMALGAEHYLN
jgi:hypothetical protein